ncbi:hypothetical protein Sjap_018719 [Stephania japonica]|uniref:Helitron helicase-like domain-containing protein n=1 Tax=Stephania japonica TaxID=461633 RepID=A0AAP0I8F9_9MAGN
MDFDNIVCSADILPSVASCQNCGARRFVHETKGFCCSNGQVSLIPNVVSQQMFDLFTSKTKETDEFLNYVRTYNNNFGFTSFGVKCDKTLSRNNMGVYTFRVQGQIYHYINNLRLSVMMIHPFCNCTFMILEHEVRTRMCGKGSDRMDEKILKLLIGMMSDNPYAKFFRNLSTKILDNHVVEIVSSVNLDQRRFNKPSVSQVAAIWVDDDLCAQPTKRDILIYNHSGEGNRIYYHYGCYDPLQYPLLFPYGDVGWHQGIEKKGSTGEHAKYNGNFNLDPRLINSPSELLHNENEGK